MSPDPDTVRIFAGCDPNDCDLEQMMVLDHSLRARSSRPLEIHWMRLSRDRSSFWYSDPGADGDTGWTTHRWATPFSGFRWGVPAFCGFQGRAIYMDTDMIALADVAELWRTPLKPGAVFAARRDARFERNCVMVWDCAAARAVLPPVDELRADAEAHSKLVKAFAGDARVQPLDPAWNCIDGEDRPIGEIKLLHYSDMGTQFSHALAIPRLRREGRAHWFDGQVLPHPRRDLVELFEAQLQAALAAGRHPDQYRAPLFGELVKKSQERYRGNSVTRKAAGWWFGRRR